MRETDLDRFALTMKFVDGLSDECVTEGELAIIYSVLPELMAELAAAECSVNDKE